MHSPVSGHIENLLLAILIQLVVIIAVSRLAGTIFRRLGQPEVCGEIAAGLVLGPSLLGGLFPDLFSRLFAAETGPPVSVISQIGLILLMFLIGLEFDFGHLGRNRSTAVAVSVTGIVLPFALGFGLGLYLHPLVGGAGSPINFALFLAAAMSITAIPILGRIMMDYNIHRTRIGSITISAAAIDDAAGWIILAVVTAIAQSRFDMARLGGMIAATAGFAAVMLLVVRPLAVRWIRGSIRGGELTLTQLALTLIGLLLAAIVTNLIGIFSIFGAFFLGAVLHDQREFADAVQRRLRDFVTAFFLPIFFTYTGLRTDIGSMSGGALPGSHGSMWFYCGLVLAAAVVGKFGGCALAARVRGLPARESAIIGVMMNTRALMELIVINIGYDLGVIPKNVFFMLVFMAVATTYVTAPVLRALIPGSEIEGDYRKSSFG